MHCALSSPVPLQVPFSYLERLPAEHWRAEWFDAMNPRAFVPVVEMSSLLQTLGKTQGSRAFRRWATLLNSTHCGDETRDRLSSHAITVLLGSDYVWLPALAWLLERLPWEAILPLCEETFGRSAGDGGGGAGDGGGGAGDDKSEGGEGDCGSPPILPPPSASTSSYKHIELAMLRENLLRHYVDVDAIWQRAFCINPEQTETSEHTETAEGTSHSLETVSPRLLCHVVRLSQLYVAHMHHDSIPACPPGGSPPTTAKGSSQHHCLPLPSPETTARVLRQGFIGHLLQWGKGADDAGLRTQVGSVLRSQIIGQSSMQGWVRCYVASGGQSQGRYAGDRVRGATRETFPQPPAPLDPRHSSLGRENSKGTCLLLPAP